MTNNIFLSICIPTYNQVNELRATLNSIVPQIKDGVEIVIGDDSDNLASSEMVKREFNASPVRYFKNHKRLGFDRNLLFVTNQARGRYVWWFGDDVFEPEALSYVLNVLKQSPDISLMWINSINSYSPNSDRYFTSASYADDKIWLNGDEALKDISILFAFVSAIIFRKEDIADINAEAMGKFIDLGFINLYVVLHLLSKNNKFYCVGKPLIRATLNIPGTATYDRFKVFGVNFYKIASSFRGKFEHKSIRILLANIFGRTWRGVLVGWLRGYDTPRGKIGVILKYYWNFPETWIAVPLFLMPKFVIQFLHFFYKKVLRRTYSTDP